MKLLKILFLIPVLAVFYSLKAQNFDHAIFDELLQKYVKMGLVDYQSLKQNPSGLNNYLKKVEHVAPSDFQQWTREEQMAFWINVYNAITIEGILRNYPIQYGNLFNRVRFPQNSIRQISGFWDEEFTKVMGRDMTLNHIEHNILRKEFNDPRIHFVIVCASVGCPILESRAFFPDNLVQRMDQATRNFISNSEKVRLDKSSNHIYLSSIFEWYKEDFSVSKERTDKLEKYSDAEKGVIEFVIQYLSETEQSYIHHYHPRIEYLDYDWSLNEK